MTTQPIDFEDAAQRSGETNRLKTTISNLYNNLVNVTVVTAIGDLGVQLTTNDDNEKIAFTIPPQTKPVDAFVTQFDLLEGDIVSTLPTNYAEHPSVQELHHRNVETATKVLPENIESVVNAGREVIKLFKA